MKGKHVQKGILYPARISFRLNREIKSFTDKQKLRDLRNTKPALQLLKELLYVEKKRLQLKSRKL